MPDLDTSLGLLNADICTRALAAHDARFDGLFFVGITSTGVYCRPVCPARVAYPDHRRFFSTAASAEHAGYRPCLRCRPELAPGHAMVDAVSRLARAAVYRIGAGALNGRGVAELARELNVSERHLRRALERELGVSPIELAQTHRLLLAKHLLTDTSLPVTQIAYASGFQSLRRFNAVFQERYRLSPSDLRKGARRPDIAWQTAVSDDSSATRENQAVRLALAYRPPLAWNALTAFLRRDALPGVEVEERGRYGRTVCVGSRSGIVFASDGATAGGTGRTQLDIDISLSLVPVLMPLLVRLRQLFDLDAEPSVVDGHLARHGLEALVRQRPGMRIPGAIDGFELALRVLLRGASRSQTACTALARRLVAALGEPLDTGHPALTHVAPTAERVAAAGVHGLTALGVPRGHASAIALTARAMTSGSLVLDRSRDATATHAALMRINGMSSRVATVIVMRALSWPDAFPVSDRALQHAAGAASSIELRAIAEQWRPWQAYAALHLWQHDEDLRRRG